MSEFHEIWIEQCEAARDIREAYGLPKALGYLIGEKLLNFLRAADEDPAFAGELPRFVAEITQIFDRAEIESYLDTVHRVGALGHVSSDEVHEEMREAGAIDEDPVEWAEEILLIERLGTRNALSPSPPRAPCPPPRATIAPPAAHVQRRREGQALLRSGAPSTTRPSWRSAERGQRPNAGGRQTRANARSQGGATERPVRLLRRARRRPRRLRRVSIPVARQGAAPPHPQRWTFFSVRVRRSP